MNASISWTVVIHVPISLLCCFRSLYFRFSSLKSLLTIFSITLWEKKKKLTFHIIVATSQFFPTTSFTLPYADACALGYLCLILCFPLLRKTRAKARTSTWVVSDKYPISLYTEYFLPPACMCAQSCPTLCDPMDYVAH